MLRPAPPTTEASLYARDASVLEPVFSSRGTKWSGLPIDVRRARAGERITFELAEHHIGNVSTSTETAWSSRGEKFRQKWRVGTSIFVKKGFRIDDHVTIGYEAVSVALEAPLVAALLHDDFNFSQVDFLEHVITIDEQLSGLLGAMLAEARGGNPAGDLFSQSISLALLAHLYERYSRSGAAMRAGRLSTAQVATITRHVRDNIGAALSVAELAGLLQLSPAYFCRAFSKTLGVTPHRFVMNERVQAARTALRRGGVSSHADLAASLGFANRAHFSSVFRRLAGCSPTDFQKGGTSA